ncbi:MAG TPA: 4a-hydroxytetrahydrobiopterin dehydratase [Pyrinomonadaceae bacterium]|nr:4a-hydroxytetrahydrobiopterin dehydratase [Pyrinomonadaceae bacterium]
MERTKLSGDEIASRLTGIEQWTESDGKLKKRFEFKDFSESLAFVNKAGEIANAVDHHPDIRLGWGYAEFEITTHDRGGLTDHDFDLAHRIDAIAD